MKKWSIVIVVAVTAVCANAQWTPAGPPNVVDRQIITTGGITYFRLVGLLPAGSCCQRIAGYAVSRQGTNLFQTVQHENWGGACLDLFCDPWQQKLASVLGALPPGDYSLTLSAQIGPGFPTPWAFSTFTVPTDFSPTLAATISTNDPSLSIQVAGVSNVLYVLQLPRILSIGQC